MRNVALDDVAGKPLVDWTLDAAIGADCFNTVYVTTDDPNVVRHCEQRGDVLADTRPANLSAPTSRLSDVLVHAVTQLERTHAIFGDVVVLLNVHCPLRTSEHIREAVDTLLLYDTDHVLSTYEDLDVHFRHGRDGLEPLNAGMTNQLRFEREALLVDNGAIHALWRDLVDPDIRLSGRIGHTVMSRAESFQIKSSFDRTLAAAMIQARIEDVSHDRGREQPARVEGLAWPARPPARGGDRR
jgi:CMP-N-acetylneuraminic acid synthetase